MCYDPERRKPDQPGCPPWELLLKHTVQAETLTRRQQESAVGHIAQCKVCADTYEAVCGECGPSTTMQPRRFLEMKHMAQHLLFITASGLIAVLAALALSATAHASQDVQEKLIVGRDKEIYGTQEAADLVAEARKFDPMFCPREQADRDQAALLYEKAIAAQPGAKLNAPLANRIAQMYAFYENKEKTVRPIRSKARLWWNRCADYTNPQQLLWAQAQMGLASMAAIDRDRLSARDRYNKILEMDVSQVKLPDWKFWPEDSSDRSKALLEREQARLRKSIERIRIRAVEKQFYVLSRTSKAAALEAMQDLASRHKGTPAGDRASDLAGIREPAATDAGAPPELPDVSMHEVKPEVRVLQEDEPQEVVLADSLPPTVTVAPEGNSRDLGVAALAIIGAAITAAGIIRIRRRNRLSHERRTR